MPDSRPVGQSVCPSIEDLKALQRRFDLLDVHLVHLGPARFTIAHTDEERALAAKHPAAMPLDDCALHQWLEAESESPEKIGYYIVVPHGVDAYSEPYPVARFDFHPLEGWVGDV